jgi:hypothetical protein
MQYFVKLLLFTVEDPTLLYGFCAPTEQQTYPWKSREPDKKLPILQYTAILDQSDKESLLNLLDTKAILDIDKCNLVLNLETRPSVLSDTSGLEWENNKPVSKLHVVKEYWNLDKIALLHKIEHSFMPCNGRELRGSIQHLFDVLKRECGIDFSREGERLGNFEYYTPGKYINSFKIKNSNNTSIIIQKRDTISEELIVNCATENEGRWISDEVKTFSPESYELIFSACEPMTHYRIKVWEKESGVLVYASECSFMMEIHIDMGIVNRKNIQDPWSRALQINASKHKDALQKIEEITVNSRYDTIHVKSEQLPPWRKANLDGKQVCSLYKRVKTKGTFIPKTADRKGEIDSFQIIRKFIDDSGIKKVILADPFFSVKSAAKLLARISSANVELNVITALTSIDPDTNEKKANIKDECKIFLNKNRNMLHPKLTIQNVLHGNHQAFHDRYIVRYFEDGHIDGFLLSNSINSAGQFFPFVISPFETEVCLEVAEYLQNLTDMDYQNKRPEKERVQIEILYCPVNSHENIEQENTYSLPQLLTGESDMEVAVNGCINLNYFKNDSTIKHFTVLPEALSAIIPMLYTHWDSDFEAAIKALGEALYHTYHGIEIGKDIIQSIPDATIRYAETISLLVEALEERQHHEQQPIHSEQFAYWSIMNGNAKIGSVSHLVDDPGLVYYKKESYWACLYRLLLAINAEEFLRILEMVKSPLMLSILIKHIAIHNFNKDLYKILLKSKWDWIHDIGAEWVWINHKKRSLDINMLLDPIETNMQLMQSAYILSRAAFHARMLKANAPKTDEAKAWELCDELVERIVILCNNTGMADNDLIQILDKVKDCEQTCNALLILSVAQSIKAETVRNAQLDRIINVYFCPTHVLPFDLNKDQPYVELVVKATKLRYENEFEKYVSSKLLHWEALNDWMEPYLCDRDYRRWSEAKKVVEWDIQFLKTYQNLGDKLNEKLQKYFSRAISGMDSEIGDAFEMLAVADDAIQKLEGGL